jgi:hypothetical protein
MATSFPLQLALDVSDCQTEAVEVFRPFPIPVMVQPAIMTGTLNAAI